MLYIIPTPIGNLEDMTHRAIRILGEVDVILCEDSRVSKRLLDHYGIKTALQPYHDFSHERDRTRILDLLRQGKNIALISDAGTPLISDPGYKLIRTLRSAGISITSLPGPCAAITALTLSGLPSDQFTFLGFLPVKQKARQESLSRHADSPATLICYETPRRMQDVLADINHIMPERPLCIAREISKQFEEIMHGTADELHSQIAGHSHFKGEAVLMIAGNDKQQQEVSDHLLKEAIEILGNKAAITYLAKRHKVSKKALYDRVLALNMNVGADS